MQCGYVGSQVELIRPETGEALGGKCLARTGNGWVIETHEEEVFGASKVVVWMRTPEQQSVIEGRLKRIEGRFMALRPVGTLLRVSHGREDRYPVQTVMAQCHDLSEPIFLQVNDVGCKGFGFTTPLKPPTDALIEFNITSPTVEINLSGRMAHIARLPNGQYRGGVELKLETTTELRRWLSLLANCALNAA